MNNLNPNAIVLWTVGASIGYAFSELHGLAIGLAIASSLTLLATFIREAW